MKTTTVRINGDETWIPESIIIQAGETELNLRVNLRRRYKASVPLKFRGMNPLPVTGHLWRYMRTENGFMYDWEYLPDALKEALAYFLGGVKNGVKSLPGKKDLLNEIESVIRENSRLYWRYYTGYNQEQVKSLSAACAALAALVESGVSCASCKSWAEALQELDVRYLPHNWRRLKQKADSVKDGKVWEVIDLPRTGNKNALKYDDAEVVSWVIQLRADPRNYTGAWIMRKVSALCDSAGKPYSEAKIKDLLSQNATKYLTSQGRHGDRGRHGHNARSFTHVSVAPFAGDAWQIDGTRVNFIPWKNPETGREEFLYMVCVRDVHSGMTVAAEFCVAEDRWVYLSVLSRALRMAGYLPYELIIDRFPGHNTPEWRLIQSRMEAMGIRVSYKHRATGKAQIERWFGTLQTVFFQDSPYYYGEGVRSGREYAHRSAEYLKAVAKLSRGWGFDEAMHEAARCIAMYNNTAYSKYSRKHRNVNESPAGLHAQSDKPNVVRIEERHASLLFGLTKVVGISNSMVRTEIMRSEYLYRVPYEVAKSYKQVGITYFLDDLSKVWLWNADTVSDMNPMYLGEAIEADRVQVFGPSADMKYLGRAVGAANQIEMQRKADLYELKAGGTDVSLLLEGMDSKDRINAGEDMALSRDIMRNYKPDSDSRLSVEVSKDDLEGFDADEFVLSQL